MSFLAAVLASAAAIGSAAGAVESERVLLPVWNNEVVAGAFGSIWQTELAIVNRGPSAVQLHPYQYGCLLVTCPPTPPTPPGVTFTPLLAWVPTEVQGFFLYVQREFAGDVEFELRVRDLSREQETWGTEVPVVRESAFRSDAFELLHVPVRAGFRQTLRIYDLDPSLGPAQVETLVFGIVRRSTPFVALQPAPADPKLLDATYDFRYATSGTGVLNYPGYVEVNGFGDAASGFESVRIEIRPLTPGHRYWAMVSVTNNTTQQVTMITPQ